MSKKVSPEILSQDEVGEGRGRVQLYSGILLSHYKEGNNAMCSNMDRPRDGHPERNKSEKEKGSQRRNVKKSLASLICEI